MKDDVKQPLWFSTWRQEEFIPHVGKAAEFESRVASMERAIYGDQENGVMGMHAKMDKIYETDIRLNTWLDGLCRLWRLTLSLLGGAAGLAAIGKAIGWW
jgi:hypothetical protein